MTQELSIIAGPDKGRRFPLQDGQTLVIGRGKDSDTQIGDPRISRTHCRVQIEGGKVILTDDGGSGGTLVGGTPIDRHELKPGEVFQVGDSQLRYLVDALPDATTLAGGQAMPKPKIVPLKDMLGQSLANYRLDKIIASGQAGIVFKAHDTEKDRVAAVKVLTPDPTRKDEQKERFVRAMKTFLPVEHPNIVRLYNAGKTGPYCWAAMEYIDGESMTDVIARIGIEGMLDWREAYRVAVHIGRALHEAYERKIIHRNVTPPNILRRHSDKACLLGDLMLAKALEGTLARQVTQPGQMVGDMAYMSPERTYDQSGVDHRSDIYGLGATLYALLTGRPPFENPALPTLIKMVREQEPDDPKKFQLSIDDMFRDVVMQMLAKRPENRYERPSQLLTALERIGKFNNLDADWNVWQG